MDWPCPVCGTKIVEDYRSTLDEGTVCESQDHCPNGCMDYFFAYGGSEERIGDKVWQYHYTETNEEWNKRHAERTAQIEKMRKERNEKM